MVAKRKAVFLILILILSVAMFGCKKKCPSDMDGIKNLVQQEIFEQKGDKYFIFFYREGCDGCEQTKDWILAYIKAINSAEFKKYDCKKIYGVNLTNELNSSMYRLNKRETGQGTKKEFWVNGVTNWEELCIGSTPSLISVYVDGGEKKAVYNAQGRDKIMDALNKHLASKKGL